MDIKFICKNILEIRLVTESNIFNEFIALLFLLPAQLFVNEYSLEKFVFNSDSPWKGMGRKGYGSLSSSGHGVMAQ